VLLHGRREGLSKDWYDDLLFVGSRICNRLLAQGIPVRGAMGFGPFLTKRSGRHLVFLGQALVEAYTAQEGQPYLGFSVPPHIWRKLYPKAGVEAFLTENGTGVLLPDDSFWINPLTEFIDHNKGRAIEQIEYDFANPKISGSGWLDGELRAFQFILSEAERMRVAGNVSPGVFAKYTNTVGFLRTSLGDELFELANKLSGRLTARATKG
jgi:hypothetical protein